MMGITSEKHLRVYNINLSQVASFIGNVCAERDNEPWAKWYQTLNKLLMEDELLFEVLKFADETSRARILKNNYLDYSEYLKSDWWKFKSNELKTRFSKCQVCSSTERLEVHHNNYDCLFSETEKDLVVLCRKCHSKFHDKEEE